LNHKAFTLIELLVVVAIIGILAAVGVVAYNGYTGAAKTTSVKSNHATVVRYISAETKKCDLGETKVMSDELVCSGKTSSFVMSAAKRALPEFKNAFAVAPLNSSYWNAVTINIGTNTSNGDVGFIRLIGTSDTEILVRSCNKTPCSNADNRQESFILIE
jgi:type IV pilus assembly protein PilA